MHRTRAPRPRPGQHLVHVLNGIAALPVRIVHDEETDEPFLEMLLVSSTPPSFLITHNVMQSVALQAYNCLQGEVSAESASKLLLKKTGLKGQALANVPPVHLVTEDGGSPLVVSIYLLDTADEEPTEGAEWFEYRAAHRVLATREEKNAACEAVRHRILRQSSWKRWADDILNGDEGEEEDAEAHSHANGKKDVVSAEDAARLQEALKATAPNQRILPATLLSGFLGAGKTTMLKHVLNNRQGLRVAVIVNDVSEVLAVSDVDSMKHGDTALSKVTDKMVEMPNGCICCTLRADLLLEVARLAQEGNFEYLLIESTGVSEPMQVAETFAFKLADVRTNRVADGRAVSDFARIDTCVTVIDARHFPKDFNTKESLVDRKWEAKEDDPRSITQLLTDQVEFADVVVVNKIDLITPQELGALKAAIAALNPDARILEADHSVVPLKEILNTKLFSIEKAATHAGWMKSIGGEPPSESQEYGITNFMFRAPIPFHPKRLHDLIFGGNRPLLDRVIRSKGFIWLATRNTHLGVWGHSGTLYTIERGRAWYASIPPDQWNLDEEESKALLKRMQTRWGDRCQELVVIGQKMNHDTVRAALEACLLTKEEMAAGIDAWCTYEDPFPSWEDDEHDHEDGNDDSADEYIL